LTERKKERKNE